LPAKGQSAQATTQVETVTVALPATFLEDKAADRTLKPAEVAQYFSLLRGLRDLVGERWGYFLGRRLTQQDMNDKTEAERKVVAEAREKITGDNLKEIIANKDVEGYEKGLASVESARKALNKVAKPFREKMSPLAKAVRYIDSVAIPDGLKELGTPVQPRFSLSKWIDDALESAKKKK